LLDRLGHILAEGVKGLTIQVIVVLAVGFDPSGYLAGIKFYGDLGAFLAGEVRPELVSGRAVLYHPPQGPDSGGFTRI